MIGFPLRGYAVLRMAESDQIEVTEEVELVPPDDEPFDAESELAATEDALDGLACAPQGVGRGASRAAT